MAYTHTNISLETTLDVVSKYKELIEVSADGNSLYIGAREVAEQLKQDNLITSDDEGTTVAFSAAVAVVSGLYKLIIKRTLIHLGVDGDIGSSGYPEFSKYLLLK